MCCWSTSRPAAGVDATCTTCASFYALLATVATGIAPFRVATYYLDEAAWEHEDIEFDQLEAAARTVADKVARAGQLAGSTPPALDDLRLVASAACRWCTRAPACPAAAVDEAEAHQAVAGHICNTDAPMPAPPLHG